MTNTPETLNILNPDFRMPEHCGGDRWSILHGDSLQILRQFEPNSFDAIITDPPYASGGSSQTTKNRSTNEKYSSMSKDKALPDFDSDQMDQLSWMFWTAAWLQDARRAVQLDPNNTEYQMHLRRMQNPGQTYRTTQTTYARPGGLMQWCWSMILLNLLCNCCCGGWGA